MKAELKAGLWLVGIVSVCAAWIIPGYLLYVSESRYTVAWFVAPVVAWFLFLSYHMILMQIKAKEKR